MLHGLLFSLKRLYSARHLNGIKLHRAFHGLRAAANPLPDMLQAALLVIDTLQIVYGVGQRCRRTSVLSLVQKLLYPLIDVFKRQIFVAAIHEPAPPRVYRDGARD